MGLFKRPFSIKAHSTTNFPTHDQFAKFFFSFYRGNQARLFGCLLSFLIISISCRSFTPPVFYQQVGSAKQKYLWEIKDQHLFQILDISLYHGLFDKNFQFNAMFKEFCYNAKTTCSVRVSLSRFIQTLLQRPRHYHHTICPSSCLVFFISGKF